MGGDHEQTTYAQATHLGIQSVGQAARPPVDDRRVRIGEGAAVSGSGRCVHHFVQDRGLSLVSHPARPYPGSQMRPYYKRTFASGLQVVKFEVGTMENNIYVVWDEQSRDAYVLDAGYEPEAIAEQVHGLNVKAVLVTHGHRDHHEHVAELRDLLNVPVGIGETDRAMLSVEPDFTITDSETLPFGRFTLRALHTPGHTPGSTCFHLSADGEHLFTGDTLFPGGPGNTQKDPGRFATIVNSIRTRLFVLPPETVVYPGHGRDTTIGSETPHLEEWIQRGW